MIPRPEHSILADDETKPSKDNPETPPKRDIYPEMNARFKTLLLWLGLGFVVAVIMIHQVSGYN